MLWGGTFDDVGKEGLGPFMHPCLIHLLGVRYIYTTELIVRQSLKNLVNK